MTSQPLAQNQFQSLSHWYEKGEVFAYPTEAVFGLGCDPLNKDAVHKILALKNRDLEKGMILIASDFSQVAPYVKFEAIARKAQEQILSTWPGPVTWLLPKSNKTPDWLSGNSNMLAVRISNHPLVVKMCNHLGKPMVSTSANPAGKAPALNKAELQHYFGNRVCVMDGELGSQRSPSKIFHSLTMETIRA